MSLGGCLGYGTYSFSLTGSVAPSFTYIALQRAVSSHCLLLLTFLTCFRFLLPAVDWSQKPIAAYMGGQEAFVYTLLTFLFLGCLLTTACITEEVGAKRERKTLALPPLKSLRCRCCPFPFLPRPRRLHDALCRCALECLSVLRRVYAAYEHVPQVIWRLFVAEVFSWMAVMSVMLFFADFMGEGLYQGVPSADLESPERKSYDEGRLFPVFQLSQ